jgi:poly(3-hydroxybutyrate) depolymerase
VNPLPSLFLGATVLLCVACQGAGDGDPDVDASTTVSHEGDDAGSTTARDAGSQAGRDASVPHDAGADGGTALDGDANEGGAAVRSAGCGALTTKLKNNPPGNGGSASTLNKLTVGGKEREFLVRWPSDYDNDAPYRLILGLHGHGGSWQESGLTNYGLWDLSKNSTIFVTLSAVGGNWDGTTDLTYTEEVLKLVEGELCIDTSRIMLEGFSQGAGMVASFGCARPGVFRAVVAHSGGSASGSCSNVAFLGSIGLHDMAGLSQESQTDGFAKVDGCTVEKLPTAQPGTHVCTPYKGCKTGFPVTWCSFDGGHDFQPKDPGASFTWMPQAVWDFLSPL